MKKETDLNIRLKEIKMTKVYLSKQLDVHYNTVLNWTSGRTKTPSWVFKILESM